MKCFFTFSILFLKKMFKFRISDKKFEKIAPMHILPNGARQIRKLAFKV